MSDKKYAVPTEIIDLPSKGVLYSPLNPLCSGSVEMKYMTAKEEDILTNVNLLRQGLAIETVLKSLIVTKINYDELIIGDRNALLVAARILAYGKDYAFEYVNPNTNEKELVTVDLSELKYKEIDFDKLNDKNEFTFKLPKTDNVVTYKILTVADDKAIEREAKSMKKALNTDVGMMSLRLKKQITSVNGDSSEKAIREFVDGGHLLAMDSRALRTDMTRNTPDIDMTSLVTLRDGSDLNVDIPITAEFFFPGTE